jgi:hypothetical protein
MYCAPEVKLRLLAGMVLDMEFSTRAKGPALKGEFGAPTGGIVPEASPVCDAHSARLVST